MTKCFCKVHTLLSFPIVSSMHSFISWNWMNSNCIQQNEKQLCVTIVQNDNIYLEFSVSVPLVCILLKHTIDYSAVVLFLVVKHRLHWLSFSKNSACVELLFPRRDDLQRNNVRLFYKSKLCHLMRHTQLFSCLQ